MVEKDMGIRMGTRYSYNKLVGKEVPKSYSANQSFLNFLMVEYGNVGFAIDLADSFINFISRFKRKSPRYQTVVNLLRYGVPATILSTELISKYKLYQKIKSGQLSTHNEKEDKIKQLIGGNKAGDVWGHPFPVGKDLLNWLTSEPQTKLFKILGYYNQGDLTKLNKLSEVSSQGAFVLIECNDKKVVWDVSIIKYQDGVAIRESFIHGCLLSSENSLEIRMCLFKEFLNHLNIRENVIYVHSSGIYSYPRKNIPENPIQFDVATFEKEILKVLSKGKKRAAVFVGVPGVGKSTVIKKLESSIRDYPLLYCTPDCFSNTWNIQETFALIQYIQPCIVVMEDMDSYDFKEKKKDLGVFLDEMDDVNGKLKAFFIATINDTSMVHHSLINRPGRFDQVSLLEPPRTHQEVYDVMKTRYDKNKLKDPSITQEFISLGDFDSVLIPTIITNKFTHADICEIIEKALLIDYAVTMKTLSMGCACLISSKKAIASCNFSGKDPMSSDYDADHMGMIDAAVPTSSEANLNFEVKGR